MTVEQLKSQISKAIADMAKSEEPRLRLSAVGLCPRQQFYSIKEGVTVDLSPMEGILATGKLFEAIIEVAFPDAIKQFEVDLDGVKGHIDFYLPNEKIFFECKSLGIAGLSYTPIEHHIKQVHAYHTALVAMGLGVHTGYLVYFPREDISQFVVYEVPYDEMEALEVTNWVKTMKRAVEENTVPPVPSHYRPNKFPCQWYSVHAKRQMVCPFIERCWSNAEITDIPDDEIEEAAIKLQQAREEKRKWEQEETHYRNILVNAVEIGKLKVGVNKGKVSIIVKERERTTYDSKKLVAFLQERLPDVDLSEFQSSTKFYEVQVKSLS